MLAALTIKKEETKHVEIEQVIATQRVYEGRVVNLRLDTVKFPGGRTATREIVEHGSSIVVAPLDGEGNVLLVRQYRLAVDQVLLELPAGGMHDGETPEQAANRELQEEVGQAAGKLERVGGYFAAPGFCQEYLYLFIATDLRDSMLPPDDDESIDVVPVPLIDVPDLIERGVVRDAKSVAGLWWMLRRLGK